MKIVWEIIVGDFLEIIEIYVKYDGSIIIFDKTNDKIFEKYTKKLSYSNICGEVYEVLYNFNTKQSLCNEIGKYIFTLEFTNEEEAFYFKLKYGEYIK